MSLINVIFNEIKINAKLIAKIALSTICVFTLFFTIVSYLVDYNDFFDSYIQSTDVKVDYYFNSEPKAKDILAISKVCPTVVRSIHGDSSIDGKYRIVSFFNFLGGTEVFSYNDDITEYLTKNHDESKESIAWVPSKIGKELGVDKGDYIDVYSAKTGTSYSLEIEGIIPEEFGGTIYISFEYFQYFHNDYFTFTLHDQLLLKKIGDVITPYYLNGILKTSDQYMGISVYHYMHLAFSLLTIVSIIVLLFLSFSLVNFTNIYYHLRNKYLIMLRSLGLNIYKKIFLLIFIITFLPSSLIGFILSIPVVDIIRKKICEIIPIEKVNPSFLIYIYVILSTILLIFILSSFRKLKYEAGDRE